MSLVFGRPSGEAGETRQSLFVACDAFDDVPGKLVTAYTREGGAEILLHELEAIAAPTARVTVSNLELFTGPEVLLGGAGALNVFEGIDEFPARSQTLTGVSGTRFVGSGRFRPGAPAMQIAFTRSGAGGSNSSLIIMDEPSGDGTTRFPGVYSIGGNGATDMAMGFLDADGLLDIALGVAGARVQLFLSSRRD